MTGWEIWPGISCGRDEGRVLRGQSSVVSFRMAESEAQGSHRVTERTEKCFKIGTIVPFSCSSEIERSELILALEKECRSALNPHT